MEEIRFEVNGFVRVHDGRLSIGQDATFGLDGVTGVIRSEPNLLRIISSGYAIVLSFADVEAADVAYSRLVDAVAGPSADAFACGEDGEVLRFSHNLLSVGWMTLHHDLVCGVVTLDEPRTVGLMLKDGRTLRLTSIGEVEHEAIYRWFTRGVLDDGKDGVQIVHGLVSSSPDAR